MRLYYLDLTSGLLDEVYSFDTIRWECNNTVSKINTANADNVVYIEYNTEYMFYNEQDKLSIETQAAIVEIFESRMFPKTLVYNCDTCLWQTKEEFFNYYSLKDGLPIIKNTMCTIEDNTYEPHDGSTRWNDEEHMWEKYSTTTKAWILTYSIDEPKEESITPANIALETPTQAQADRAYDLIKRGIF